MKKLLLFFSFLLIVCQLNAQTATNFTCNDCSGASHDLFTELDSGNIIVISWVMPCASCVSPTLTTYNVVQSYETTHPGKVRMYVCDDYADIICSQLNSWANSNGIMNTRKFSDSQIKMTDYGTEGMPKTVILAGSNHQVFYNKNNSVVDREIQAAIDSALSVSATLSEINNGASNYISPNPALGATNLILNSESFSSCSIQILTIEGKLVVPCFTVDLLQGINEINLPVSNLQNGIYLVLVAANDMTREFRLSVNK